MYIRWLQFGTFNPAYARPRRGAERDPWTYGVRRFGSFAKCIGYAKIYLTAFIHLPVRAHTEGVPAVMNMAAAFPEEGIMPDVNGQYMFCERLLVCPVLEEGANKKEIVFPSGSWYGLFGGERVSGGVTETVSAEI